MRHYTLKYSGNLLKNRELPLVVGQCNDADLRLPSDQKWTDENYFVIIYSKDDDAWCLVRLSPNVDIRLNGNPVGDAVFLADGDVIDAEDTTLRFGIEENPVYKSDDGIVLSPAWLRRRRRIAAGSFVTLTLLIIATFFAYKESKKIPDSVLSSVKNLTIDSIFVQRMAGGKYENIEAVQYSSSGTCFVTQNGMLVTARHCIHPWLNFNPSGMTELDGIEDPMNDSICHMVMRAETAKILEDSTVRVVTKIRVDDKIFWSSDFSFNTQRDIIANMGTRDKPSYWRSIRPSYHKRDNELGDIAWLSNCGFTGDIRLASKTQIASLEKNEEIVVLGYSKHDNGSGVLMTHSGILREIPYVEDNIPGAIFHNDDTSPGDSGGPVFIRRGWKYYVISVLSRKDVHRPVNSSWSIPVTEIEVKNEKR